jgi:hypothetical protein
MRRRSWVTAILSPSCGLLLVFAASGFPVASEIPLPSSNKSSIKSAGVLVAAAEETPAPTVDTDQNIRPGLPAATILDTREGRGILGSAVRSATNEDMGRIVDVVVDRAGAARAAVIDFGGFLGVGSRKIAVDWNAMRFTGTKDITIDLTRDQVKAAPQYQEGKPIMVLSAAPEFARSRITERMPER